MRRLTAGLFAVALLAGAAVLADAQSIQRAGSYFEVLTVTGPIYERGRTTPLGEWTSVAFNAANYTAPGGSWTVASGDQSVLAYSMVGKTMTLVFTINTSTVAGGPVQLNLAIPGGFVSARTTLGPCTRTVDNGAAAIGLCETIAASSNVRLYTNVTAGTAWAAATDTTSVSGRVTLEVQ